ncbi:MAG: AAA family ATPase [candidate division WOR-3 bacterium]
MVVFRRTLGQIVAKEMLKKILNHDIHTLMFVGPPGVGKATLALEFSQVLVCKGEEKPCGECYGCKRFGGLRSPDLFILSGKEGEPFKPRPDDFYESESTIKISQVRSLQSELQKPPFEFEKRVVIIMNIENANLESQNALLKVLEEGSKSTIFILISSKPTYVLPTVKSRALHIRFSPLSYGDFIKVVGEESEFLYRVSEGSPGIAKGFLRMGEDFHKAVEVWERVINFKDNSVIELGLNLFEKWKGYFLRIGYAKAKEYYYDFGDWENFKRILFSLRDVEVGFKRYTYERILYLSALWNYSFGVI